MTNGDRYTLIKTKLQIPQIGSEYVARSRLIDRLGVHSTGTRAATLLSVLGVTSTTVRDDYLLSNKFRQGEVQNRLKQLRQQEADEQGIAPEEVDPVLMHEPTCRSVGYFAAV